MTIARVRTQVGVGAQPVKRTVEGVKGDWVTLVDLSWTKLGRGGEISMQHQTTLHFIHR